MTRTVLTLLRDPIFRAVLVSNALGRFGAASMTVMLGFQVFDITRNPLDLGWLGLIEAVPRLSLALYGGHIADRYRRRAILLGTSRVLALLTFAAAASSAWTPTSVAPLFAIAFLFGLVRAFEDPAAAAIEAQVLPLSAIVRGTAILATCARLSEVLGPAIGGLIWAWLGPVGTYATIGTVFVGAFLALLPVPDASQPTIAPDGQSPVKRIAEGVRFVIGDQLLLGSMLLDLFAVFFGGATALLPAVASEILHVGPTGFGLLRSAPAAGALLAALMATRLLPERRAGLALLWVIAGFGLSMILFGLSQLLWLSLVAMFLAGFFDGISMVVRNAILRLASPEAMRGRIASMKSLFVGSSNELGAFESGVAASLLGVSAAIWVGGAMTIGIVVVTAVVAPRLRRLDLIETAQQLVRRAAPTSAA